MLMASFERIIKTIFSQSLADLLNLYVAEFLLVK